MANNKEKSSWLSDIIGKYKDNKAMRKSKSNLKKINKKLMQKWFSGDTGLIPGIMGQNNYNKAYNTVKNYIDNGNMKAAREYVKSQKRKINKERSPIQIREKDNKIPKQKKLETELEPIRWNPKVVA